MIRAGAGGNQASTWCAAAGINVKRLLYRTVFAVGVALAACGRDDRGAREFFWSHPNMGSRHSAPHHLCLVVVVIGGVGSISRRAGLPSLLAGFGGCLRRECSSRESRRRREHLSALTAVILCTVAQRPDVARDDAGSPESLLRLPPLLATREGRGQHLSLRGERGQSGPLPTCPLLGPRRILQADVDGRRYERHLPYARCTQSNQAFQCRATGRHQPRAAPFRAKEGINGQQ